MNHIEISGVWLNRLEPELIPWLQKELSPEGYDGQALPGEHANTINIYIGADTVNLHLPPMAFPCMDPHGWVEKQFTAALQLEDLDHDVHERLNALHKKHREEYAMLKDACETFRSHDLCPEFLRTGYIALGMVPDKFFAWDWDAGQVDSESVGAFVKGMEDMFMVIYTSDGRLAFRYDDYLAAPEKKPGSAEKACELLDRFADALDKKHTDQQSEILINLLFN